MQGERNRYWDHTEAAWVIFDESADGAVAPEQLTEELDCLDRRPVAVTASEV